MRMGEAVAQRVDWFGALEGDWQLRRRILQWGPKHGLADGLTNVLAKARAADGRSEAHHPSEYRTSPPGLPEGMVVGRLSGVARFTRIDQATLHYREEGALCLRQPGGRQLPTTVHAVREYRYRRDGDAWRVDFADGPTAGDPFLRLDPVGGDADRRRMDDGDDRDDRYEQDGRDERGQYDPPRVDEAGLAASHSDWIAMDHHLCGRDLYQAVYRLHGFAQPGPARPRIVQRTTVTGPRKDYAIVSVLRRWSNEA